MNPKRVEKNWVTGLWNLAALKKAYAVGIITKEEYKRIKELPQDGQLNAL